MMNKIFLLLLLPVLVSGCSRFALGNNSLDYQKAGALPALQVPSGVEMRRQTPLYPVPEVQQSTDTSPRMTNSRGNRYVLPQPLPLDANQVAARNNADIGVPAAPVMVVDGNGYPLLRTEGNASRIWSMVGQALQAAGLSVSHQDESRGLIQLIHDQQPVSLRLDRSGNSTLITVQAGNGQLAEAVFATGLLQQIAGHWGR